jgi:PEP-CTERM motif
MKQLALLSLFALLFVATFANAQCGSDCVFYGGDLNVNSPNADALANENDATIGGSPYGAATYQNFTLPNNTTAYYSLFTNNLSGLNPTTGYWEIRTGVSEGNGGTLVASGTGAMTQTATGRSAFGFTEYRDEVDGLFLSLNGGTQYWFAVVPNDPNSPNRSFNSNSTDGINAVGTQTSNLQFFNAPAFGANFTNADNEGPFPTFSSGVEGFTEPEPSSFILLGTGLVGVGSVVRRRLSR